MADETTEPKKLSRIQQRNRELIMNAALDVFSQNGFRGATLDQIAEVSGLSKPNILYYFGGKEDIYINLLNNVLSTWSDPLKALNPGGDPVSEIISYIERKMEMSRKFPQESRLFANEIVQGGSRVRDHIVAEVRPLFEEKSAVIQKWVDDGKMAPVDPRHLIMSIWATTQHYSDFDAQIQEIFKSDDQVLDQGTTYLTTLFTEALKPR